MNKPGTCIDKKKPLEQKALGVRSLDRSFDSYFPDLIVSLSVRIRFPDISFFTFPCPI